MLLFLSTIGLFWAFFIMSFSSEATQTMNYRECSKFFKEPNQGKSLEELCEKCKEFDGLRQKYCGKTQTEQKGESQNFSTRSPAFPNKEENKQDDSTLSICVEKEGKKTDGSYTINKNKYKIFKEIVGPGSIGIHYFCRKINGVSYKYILTKIENKEYFYPDIKEQIKLWTDFYNKKDNPTDRTKVLKTLWDMALDYACQVKKEGENCPANLNVPSNLAAYKKRIIQLAYSISRGKVLGDLNFGRYEKVITEVEDQNEDISKVWSKYEEQSKNKLNDKNYWKHVKKLPTLDARYAMILYPQGAFKYSIPLDMLLKDNLFPIAFGLHSVFHPHGGGVDNPYRLMIHDFAHADAYYTNFPKDKLGFIQCIYNEDKTTITNGKTINNNKNYLIQAMIFYFFYEVPLKGNLYGWITGRGNEMKLQYMKNVLNMWMDKIQGSIDLRDIYEKIHDIWQKDSAFGKENYERSALKLQSKEPNDIKENMKKLITKFSQDTQESMKECLDKFY